MMLWYLWKLNVGDKGFGSRGKIEGEQSWQDNILRAMNQGKATVCLA